MSSALKISGVQLAKTSFINDFKSLPPDVKKAAEDRLKVLIENPRAGSLRLHQLGGYHPTIYSIDITSGKGPRYKATFRLEGSVAVLLRIGTHKRIDTSPE